MLKSNSKNVKGYLNEKGVTIIKLVKAKDVKRSGKKKKNSDSDDENNDEDPFFIEILSET